MLGGVAEMYAYGSSARRFVPSCCESEENTSKACDATSAIFGGFKNSFVLPEDFILIAECDESSGPEPLVVIPKGGGRGLNLNSLTLKLLSSDYQGYGTISSVPIKDTQALFPDILPNIHAVVNYFALADIHSRGYVRPVCIAYLTSDKFKLIQNFLALKQSLCEVCRTIQFHNRNLFAHEIENTVQDLIFTKGAMQSNEDSPVSKNTTVSKLQEELLDVTISDLQYVQKNLQPLIDADYNEKIQDAIHFVECLKKHQSYSIVSSLFYHQWHFQKLLSVYKPHILKLPLRSNFKDKLRPAEVICDIGFPIGLYLLHVIHKIFARKYENVFLTTAKEPESKTCLRFGACLKESTCQSSFSSTCNNTECGKFLKMVPRFSEHILKGCYRFMDSDFFNTLSHFYSNRMCANNSWYSDCNDNKISSEGDPPSGVFCNSDHICNAPEGHSSTCYWHGCSTVGLLDIIDQMEEMCPDTALALDVLQQCNHLPELFYSLLMGQCIVIMGSSECASLVQALVRVLGVLCPRDPSMPLYVQPWREVATSLKELADIAVLGVPLPCEQPWDKVIPESVMVQVFVWNIHYGTFSGHTYKGILLSELNKRLKSVPPKGPLLSTLVSFLADLELNVQVWRAMCEKSNRGAVVPNTYFTQKGYSRNDLDILETLATMVS